MTHRPVVPEGRGVLTLAGGGADGAGCPVSSRPFVLAATILASAMAFIDGSVVNIALPAIQHGLDADIAALQWVLNGYLLMVGALLLVGGFLIDTLSWRVAFWINVPIAVIAVWLTYRHVPESRDATARGGIDWAGALAATVGFGAITFGLVEAGEASVRLWQSIGAIVLGIALVAAFVAIEWRAANPVMPPVLFKSRVFAGGNIVTVLLYGALSGSLFLLPFELLVRRGMTAAAAGLVILPFGIIIGVMSRAMGGLADKHGPRLFMTVGPLLVAAGCGSLALALSDLWIGVIAPVVLLAVGMGIVVSPLTTAVMNAVPEGRSGAASGVNNAASRLAGVFAVAIVGLVVRLVYVAAAPQGAPRFGVLPAPDAPLRAGAEAAFLGGYGTAMGLVAVAALLAGVAAWLTIPKGKIGEGPPGSKAV